ncbi:MAG: alpha-ketoacid dehydrogenase subunit beta [Desulfobacterales bacterium]|nr:MAG: alpha-ketoacid dehydrogenase subunit beta [Desulfobacterales bacterium]
MKDLFYIDAVNEALTEEMARDDKVFIIGEDIAVGYGGGGVFGATRGLFDKFGSERVIDAPLSESAIAGCAIGAALVGYRPIVELMFGDFLTIASEQIVNCAAKMRWSLGGKVDVPIVYRTAYGGGVGAGMHHSQCFESWFAGVPGLKVVLPSTSSDVKGLLKAAVRDNDPVLVLEHKFLYKRLKGPVPENDYIVPIGKGDIKKEGDDVTIIAMSAMVQQALEAAKILEQKNIQAEVLDPRTILPLDEELILQSVEKTGKVVIVHEAPVVGGFGGEIAAILADKGINFLEAPVKRLGAPFCPVPSSPEMEQFYLPNAEKIVKAVLEIA